ncbi:uncharacterized protein LOC108157562 isoform X1 [Drosophila miranda]|uniref:uncharacterized protein LOC108157562 isoform X1 n=1 Tax=Drosophila miranda TaxID=7229 RepID=UPI0007E77BAA|nr:uncharacterized protein LOC108157562 isoform X1 [Drosophila miranda]XP_017145168.1 uncharacterized protein LOC108157562 isoform X1 [Drosophila miranda]
MSQGTPQKQPLFHGYSVLSTFFAFTVKVEPQSLQLRCQNDKRRPLAQFWPTTPHCLSPQTTPEVLYTDCSSTSKWHKSKSGKTYQIIAETGLETGTHTGYRPHHRPKASRSVNVVPGFGGAGAALANHADVAKTCLHPPNYDRLPERTPAGVQQEYPCPASWANSQKPRNIAVHALKARRLLFSTDFGSHQTIIRARVDGNEGVELEGVTALALDQQSEEVIDINGKNKKTIASMHIPQVNNIAT